MIMLKKKYDERKLSCPAFFELHVQYNISRAYDQRRGIEDQVEYLANLYGSLIETLIIRGVINADDINRIMGSYFPMVEIIDNE